MHFMRSTPLEQWRVQAEEFDRQVRLAAETILGMPFTEGAYLQASLTPTLGGMASPSVRPRACCVRRQLP